MRRKIDVSGRQEALQNPFALLEMEGLPPAPEPPGDEALGPAAPAAMGRVVLRREKSGRGGKTVMVADGFGDHLDDSAIAELAKDARQACGCGGTVRGRSIELQGDMAARVGRFFRSRGFRVAGVGQD
jgi:translation initiation factor 1